MAGFDNPWYAEIIERFAPKTAHVGPLANKAIDGHAQALLAAACIIAQSIDAHAKALESVAQAARAVSRRFSWAR